MVYTRFSMYVLYIIVMVIIFIAGFSYWFLHRLYKRIARRCRKKGCGRTGVERVSKILLAQDEMVSFRSTKGKLRWFIRRVINLTFTRCKCGCVELVKIDTDPMSVWHAWWAKKMHKDQYILEDPVLIDVAQKKMRQLYLGGRHESLDPQATDTPDLSFRSLSRDYFEEISNVIDKV